MGYPMGDEKIDEVIEEIVKEGRRKIIGEDILGEFQECPSCHHLIPINAKYCPYCFEILDEDVDMKFIIKELIDKLNYLARIATSRDIYVPALIDNIKTAKGYIKKGDLLTGHRLLQDSYIDLMYRITNSIIEEARRYRVLLKANPEARENFKKLENLAEEWDIEGAIKILLELEADYEDFSRALQNFLEELERAERAIGIAEDFGINTSIAVETIDMAKDEADNRNYKKARELLQNAFLPLKSDIERCMNETLDSIKNSVENIVYRDEITAKKIIKLLNELKFYWKEGNLITVLEKLEELKGEL
ncbi:hypothetical protein B6U71_01755 [Euryarchaeota archaeon ex4484_178]|nr:MAG: hypothetical protein B6U71_01755 [Euryarchaeota archaeon ex4484_178]